MTTQRLLHFALGSVLLVAVCALPFAVAHAQSASANLSGTVEDQNGAVIPGVAITVQNVGTSLKRQATTNESGSFRIPLLPPGTYTVLARRDGFTPVEVRDVALNVGDQKALQIQLKAGSINEQVQVTNDAPLINESPAVGTVIDRQFVGNLPLNGRTFQSLILLTPGIVPVADLTSSPRGQFSVNGQRTNANYFTVDGVSANVGATISPGGSDLSITGAGTVPGLSAQGSTNSLVSVDALEEFKIQTSTYSAEFGRQPGGQVQLVTRSGGNQFHGTAFDYLRNDALDARNYFNKKPAKKPPERLNDFGATLSGPVMLPRFGEGGKPYWSGRNRTFFFFSYEGQRLLLPVSAGFNIPSLRLRQAAAPALQPLLNSFPLPTGPETLRNGVLSGAAPWVGSYSSPKSLDATSIRIDHAVSNKLTVFGRYNISPSNNTLRTLNSLGGAKFDTRTLTLGSTFTATSRLTNEFRANYSSNRARNNFVRDNFGGAVPVDQSVLLSGYNGAGTKLAQATFSFPGVDGFIINLGDAIDSSTRQTNLVDNLSYMMGGHQFKFGIDYRRMAPIYGPVAYKPFFSFFSVADIISGTISSLSVTASQGARPLFDNYSLYAEDHWKPSPRLTLDFGVRWELNPAPRDANGLKPVLVTGVNSLSTATLAPPDAPFYKTFYKAFAPRLGVAYLLRKGDGRETVVRGGFGIYHDLGSSQAANAFSGYPFVSRADFNSVPFSDFTSVATPPAFPTVTLPTGQILNALDPNLKDPHTLQWSLAVQQSLGRQQAVTLSYVAAAGRNLLNTQTLNFADPITFVSQNPNFGPINYVTNGSTSDYKSLQVQFQRRLSRGLQALANYTWSHATDTISDEVNTNTLERASSDFDVRHNFSAAVTYDLPRLKKGGRFVGAIANGWSMDYLFYAYSGKPVNPSAGSYFRSNGQNVSVRPDVVAGVPFWIKDPTVPGGQRFNLAAFTLQPKDPRFNPGSGILARQGTLGRNAVRLPGVYQINMALRRQFNISEQWKLQFAAEAFNVLNHPLFAAYNTDVSFSNPTAGVPKGTLNTGLGGLGPLYQLGGPRSIQLSLRVSF
ncbi:MAG TPA: TonB-dependent receptor [Pyrinomonadaceae bacterium]